MDPTSILLLALVSLAILFIVTTMVIIGRSVLSDETMEFDMDMIRRLLGDEDTDRMLQKGCINGSSLLEYYNSTTGIDYRILQYFVGPGMHSLMNAPHPILGQCGNTRQGIMIMGEIRAVRSLPIHSDDGILQGVEGVDRVDQDSMLLMTGRGCKARVLEVGCGKGHCTLLLAGLCKDVQFHGIDIIESHIKSARSSASIGKYKNVGFSLKDVRDISPSGGVGNKYDVIFGCESLCHMDTYHDMDAFVRVARNLLVTNGRVVVCDGFRGESYSQCNTMQKDCMLLAECGFSIREMPSVASWTTCFESNGFKRIDYVDLTKEVLPFWRIGWKVARLFLMYIPCIFRYLYRKCPRLRQSIHSMVSVMTVAQSFKSGAADYGLIVFELRDTIGG